MASAGIGCGAFRRKRCNSRRHIYGTMGLGQKVVDDHDSGFSIADLMNLNAHPVTPLCTFCLCSQDRPFVVQKITSP